MKKSKVRVVHWGIRNGNTSETLCGKSGGSNGNFAEYSHLTENVEQVTCKYCVEALKNES